ncbi:glycosyltransferase family A protein [Roseateles sp.]|uniref:glycosyltransferase family A protein n=1 Tax=Roseateles sp. TaxID=1971397 RepID=UPI002DFFC94B|nr:glycosyltransferase family A protein [Roseateles sp.]
MASIAVIIPTTGDVLVREAIASVLAQTAPGVTPFIVIDGPRFQPTFQAATAGMDLSRCHVVTLPVNVGGGGFYGHRIYAAFSHLVDTELVAYLDQDNRFHPEHLARLAAALAEGRWDWGFALRRVVDPGGAPLMDDESQSVGPWGSAKPYPLVDTNCYLLKTDVAHRVASYFHGGWGQDRVFYAALSQLFPNYGCSGAFTVDYRTREDLQPKVVELLTRENAAIRAKFGGRLPFVGAPVKALTA